MEIFSSPLWLDWLGAHPVSFPMDTTGCFPQTKNSCVKLTHSNFLLMSRMHRALLNGLHINSWCCTLLQGQLNCIMQWHTHKTYCLTLNLPKLAVQCRKGTKAKLKHAYICLCVCIKCHPQIIGVNCISYLALCTLCSWQSFINN